MRTSAVVADTGDESQHAGGGQQWSQDVCSGRPGTCPASLLGAGAA